MTLKELNQVVRVLPQMRKLEVIEEHMFDEGNDCHETFKKTGNFRALTSASNAYRTAMRAIYISLKHHVAKGTASN